MVIRIDLTDTDKDSHLERGWEITPFFMPPVIVAPPPIADNFSVLLLEQFERVGRLHITDNSLIRSISKEAHDNLVDQSLDEYGDIWSRLAQR